MSNYRAADLPAGTRVTTPTGRLGAVCEENRGHVTDTDHANYGREYVSVHMDAIDGDKGLDRFGRFFVDELRIDLRQPVADTCSVCGKEDCKNEVCGTEGPTDAADREQARREATTTEPTWQAAQFDDFAVGDRVRFQTIDNGFGGSGDFIMREGTVAAVTPRTLRVECGPNPFGSRAVLSRANWYHRYPQKATDATV